MYHKNVGSKSTAKDSQGRNPLEIASVPGDGRVAVTLIYHAVDDPVAANQAYGFSVAGITFANSKDGLVTIPTVGKVSSFKATAQSKALKLTWKKASVSGYEIQYSTSKSFAKSKTATIRVAKTKTAYTIKKLGGGQKYYVRIRAYKNYKDELGQTVKAYGKWSNAVSKTTKKYNETIKEQQEEIDSLKKEIEMLQQEHEDAIAEIEQDAAVYVEENKKIANTASAEDTIRLQTERDTYKTMYEQLLNRLVNGGAA